jgi:hypothetical protein
VLVVYMEVVPKPNTMRDRKRHFSMFVNGPSI